MEKSQITKYKSQDEPPCQRDLLFPRAGQLLIDL
jgi:hypothetical protein